MHITFFCVVFSNAYSQQYYLRGEIKDENNNSIGNAKILSHSTHYIYTPDTSGVFEILINGTADSVTISADGYKPLSTGLEAGQYQYIILDQVYNPKLPGKQLISLVKHRPPLLSEEPGAATGSSDHSLVENLFVEANKFPETEFAANSDKVSYDNFRRYIHLNSIVPADALRIEELLNYFNLDYHEPAADSSFSFSSYLSQCPWNPKNQLLLCHMNAKKIDLDKIPSASLVFLIDASGSMSIPNRLPLLKSALHFLVNNLREKDTISMIAYGAATTVLLPPTPGSHKKEILAAVERLQAGGSIPGDIAIKNAYTIAENQFNPDGNNRIILATDGDFNIGEITQEELEKMIMMHKRWGIYLSCFGLGMGNKRADKLQVLAERGGGAITYVNDQKSAEQALMREFAQIDYSVADSAYFSIQFDSNLVQHYRLIGYENKMGALKDTASQIAGGPVSYGSSTMALFEITPTPDSVRKMFPGQSIGELRFSCRLADNKSKKVILNNLPSREILFPALPPAYRFASAVAWCGLLMKKSPYASHSKWRDAVYLLNRSYDKNDIFQKEFNDLIGQAKKIYR